MDFDTKELDYNSLRPQAILQTAHMLLYGDWRRRDFNILLRNGRNVGWETDWTDVWSIL